MKIYLGLGSNLGDRETNIGAAVEMLEGRIGPLLRLSSLIETEPVGFSSPHRFLNAAAVFATFLSPLELLRETQEVERLLGRTRKSVDGIYADRTIDIDLLLLTSFAGDVSFSSPTLTLPHPHLRERDFVTTPLRELGLTL